MEFESIIIRESFGWVLGLIGGILFFAGIVFDQITDHLEAKGWAHGRSSILVAIGVAGTLLGAIPLIGVEAAGIVFVLFICSGTPMALGQLLRHQRNLTQFVRRLQGDDRADRTS